MLSIIPSKLPYIIESLDVCGIDLIHRMRDVLGQRKFEFINDIFQKYENKIIIAGGFIVDLLLFKKDFNDIDFFFATTDFSEIKGILKYVSKKVSEFNKIDKVRVFHYRSDITLTYYLGKTKLQFILRTHKNKEMIFKYFDLDCCCVAWDGKSLYYCSRSEKAFQNKTNVIIDNYRNRTDSRRILKYFIYKGFGIKFYKSYSKGNINYIDDMFSKVPSFSIEKIEHSTYETRIVLTKDLEDSLKELDIESIEKNNKRRDSDYKILLNDNAEDLLKGGYYSSEKENYINKWTKIKFGNTHKIYYKW